MRVYNFIVVLSIILFSCSDSQLTTAKTSMDKLQQFKAKEKFVVDEQSNYSGLANPALRSILNEKMNRAAGDFQALAKRGATETEYQDAIKAGLGRFDDVYPELDTEDRERVCHYFEELMDMVGLESSGGHLNNFMYGFDPNGFKE